MRELLGFQVPAWSGAQPGAASLALYLARRYDLAEQCGRQVLHADPANTWSHITLGRTLQAMGRGAEALPLLERARELEPGLSEAVAAVGNADARAADARAALAALHELEKKQYVSPIGRSSGSIAPTSGVPI